jgi:hypothetical protein
VTNRPKTCPGQRSTVHLANPTLLFPDRTKKSSSPSKQSSTHNSLLPPRVSSFPDIPHDRLILHLNYNIYNSYDKNFRFKIPKNPTAGVLLVAEVALHEDCTFLLIKTTTALSRLKEIMDEKKDNSLVLPLLTIDRREDQPEQEGLLRTGLQYGLHPAGPDQEVR